MSQRLDRRPQAIRRDDLPRAANAIGVLRPQLWKHPYSKGAPNSIVLREFAEMKKAGRY